MPLNVVGGAEVTSRPLLINVDKMFQKDTKAVKRGEHEERLEANRRTGKGSTKVADWHVFKPVFIREVLGDKGRYSDT